MKIVSLELKGYKRLRLNNINYIKITPKNKIQLILGSNGSGKSSLLKEFSVLPAIANEYDKDGYKVIEVLHNNITYILKSIFTNGIAKYYFLKDNEELNPGNTITVFREIVKKEFNITQEIHDILIGSKFFHDMSTNERRTWFTRISNTDYNYAFYYYNKLKEQLKETQGIIKYNQAKLVQESNKVLTKDNEIKLKEDLTSLRSLLTELLSSKMSINHNKNSLIEQIKTYNLEIEKISNLINNKVKSFTNDSFLSKEDIERNIITYQSYIKSIDMSLVDLYKVIDIEEKTLSMVNKTKVEDIKDIDGNINDINNSINSLSKLLNINILFDNPKETYLALTTIMENLIQIFTNLDENKDKKYSRDKHIFLLEQNTSFKKQLEILNRKQDIFLLNKKELEHYKEHNKEECPKCLHIWIKGYDENKYQLLLKNIEQNSKEIEILEKQIFQSEEKINNSKEYIDLYKSYLTITKNWSILDSFWNYLLSKNIIFDTPKKIPSILEMLREDLLNLIKIDDLNNKIKELEKLKELFLNSKDTDLKNINKSLINLEAKLTNCIKQKRDYETYLNKLYLFKQLSNEITILENKLNMLIESKDKNATNIFNIIRQEHLNKGIELIQLEISKYEIQISRIDTQKIIIENIEKQIIELTNKQDMLKIALKELSPTEGLIAESLSGFINYFVLQVNSFIKKVWSYPLELIPVIPDESEDIDLDYKFAVRINDNVPIPDITKASTAMKEIINLAFKLVSMQYLGLNNAPIFLDELGSSFDKAHRGNVILLIQNLLTTSNFSQIYIISHYEEMFGSLKNSDVTVLCDANIPMLKNDLFNINTVIK